MHIVLKIFLGSLAAIVGIASITAASIWIIGGAKLNQKFIAPDIDIAHSTDPQIIAHGERLVTLTGCSGCHSERLQGKVMAELPEGSRLVASNIPRVAASLTDGELAKIIRYGVRPDETGVVVMPSQFFFTLTDDDLKAILSYIRATPDEGEELPQMRIGLMPRLLFMLEEFEPAPAYIEDFTARPSFDFTNKIDHGKYLALLVCAECHGLDFKGQEMPDEASPPDLIVTSAYTRDEFTELMRSGASLNGRDLGLMGEVARYRFSAFTDDEIDALYAFLTDRAAKPL
jgi:mono/diheme cytochrome c family protein